ARGAAHRGAGAALDRCYGGGRPRRQSSALGARGTRLPDAPYDPHHGALGRVAASPAEAAAGVALPPAGEADIPRPEAVRAAPASRAAASRPPPGTAPGRDRTAAAVLRVAGAGSRGEEDRSVSTRWWRGYAQEREISLGRASCLPSRCTEDASTPLPAPCTGSRAAKSARGPYRCRIRVERPYSSNALE